MNGRGTEGEVVKYCINYHLCKNGQLAHIQKNVVFHLFVDQIRKQRYTKTKTKEKATRK